MGLRLELGSGLGLKLGLGLGLGLGVGLGIGLGVWVGLGDGLRLGVVGVRLFVGVGVEQGCLPSAKNKRLSGCYGYSNSVQYLRLEEFIPSHPGSATRQGQDDFHLSSWDV